MRVLMLLWADQDATSGGPDDLQAWVDFDDAAKKAGVFVVNGALRPASSDARLVRTAIDGHDLSAPGTVQPRALADGDRQVQAFYLVDVPDEQTALEWANRLPTYGYVEVRPLLDL